ncbi:MAG: adenylate/guanylate cyclase domain-containing protein [Desulfobaccales bacterium]
MQSHKNSPEMRMSRTKKAISIRFSLLRSFIVLILISSLTVLILMNVLAHKTEKELSEKLISRGTLQATEELDKFFQPVNRIVLMTERWGLANKLNLAEVVASTPGKITKNQISAATKINTLLLPLMQVLPELSSLQIGNDRGEALFIIRLNSGRIRDRVVSRDRWGTSTLWFDVDQDGRATSPEWKELDYDPRTRAWYAGLENFPYGEVFWSEPFLFFTMKEPGITASVKWNDQGVDYVFSADILLSAISDFTRRDTTQVTAHSETAIYTRQWQVVGLPRNEKFRDPEAIRRALLRTVGEMQIPEIIAAVNESNHNAEISKHLKESGKAIFSYDYRGKIWWAGFTSYPLGKTCHLWISILVPNNDLLEGLVQFHFYVLAGSLVALLSALAYSFLLARSYSKPLEALAAQSRAIGNLDFRTEKKIEAKFHEFRQLEEAQAHSMAALQSFAHYVPLEVVKELVHKGEVARIGGRVETLTILFTDIAGFTKMAESMTPEALTNHMAEYFQGMIDILHKYSATVDKIIGDAIVAFWGAPTPVPESADMAIQAVLECQSHLKALKGEWQARGLPSLPTRFGLATGPVVVGNIGARTRLAYTVIGDPVNLASRLEGLNNLYGSSILVDEATRRACSGSYEWRHMDRVIVVGKTEPTEIFEVLGKAGTVAEKALAGARRYETAWDRYRSGDFRQALKALEGFESEFGPDLAVQLLRERCEESLKSPPGDGWDGTSKMTSK